MQWLARRAAGHPARASFNRPILLRLARVDVMLFDAIVVGPLADGLAGELSAVVRDDAGRLRRRYFRNPLSHGGIVSVAEAVRLGAASVLSGPAGGIVGARMAARVMGLDHVLPFDMGGTSTEIALVVQRDPPAVPSAALAVSGWRHPSHPNGAGSTASLLSSGYPRRGQSKCRPASDGGDVARQVIAGPVLIEGENTTALLHAGDGARVTDHGSLDIAVNIQDEAAA